MMILFDPNDPYPLLAADDYHYAEAQAHAELVDSWLGLETAAIEETLKPVNGQNLWVGLPVQALLTPYAEIRRMLWLLAPQPGQHIIDLGAGYGRMAFVIGRHYPDVRFTGYEFVQERVNEAQSRLKRWSYANAQVLQADLASPAFQPADAEYYFIYDYGTRDAIRKTLQDLRQIAARKPIVVIGRGRGSRDIIERETPWLSQIRQPEHHGNFSIYRS